MFVKDITQDLQSAMSQDGAWPVSTFFSVIGTLRDCHYEVSFWMDEESWASVFFNSDLIAYVWKRYPLIVSDKQSSASIQNCLSEFSCLTYIRLSSLTEGCLKVNPEVLNSFFLEGLNTESFSAVDLWFHTNSI